MELALGLLLLSGFVLRWVALAGAAAGLLLHADGALLCGGLQIDCGCFGPGEALGPKTLLRDGALVALAAAVASELFADKLETRKLKVHEEITPCGAPCSSLLCNLASAAQLPRQAPEFVFKSADGKQTLLSSYKGKPIVIAFMYATCSHCQHTAGLLNGMQADFKAKGVQTLGAVFGEGDMYRVNDFIKTFGVTFPVGFSDSASVLSFLQHPAGQMYSVPILVFIDKKGMIQQAGDRG